MGGWGLQSVSAAAWHDPGVETRIPSGLGAPEALAGMDIYLLDQLLRGRIEPGTRILDAGCGRGRNVRYFLRAGFPVWGVDENAAAIAELESLRAIEAPEHPAGSFRVEPVEATSFDDDVFDLVVCNAVLHFARDDRHFGAMLDEIARVLAPGGLLFARLASTIGIETLVDPIEGRWHALPDGTNRYLVDEELLLTATARLGGELADPIKTTVVQGMRSMTTWVVRLVGGKA